MRMRSRRRRKLGHGGLARAIEGACEALQSMLVRLNAERERKELVCNVHD